MEPVIAIVGRPNVGKSTLFNRLTRSREALVDDRPGVTRDRLYAHVRYDGRSFSLIDTGGFEHTSNDPLAQKIQTQIMSAIKEADGIIFVVDGRQGILPLEQDIARMLRPYEKKVYVAANKIDGPELENLAPEFYALGFSNLFPISAAHGYGVRALLAKILDDLPETRPAEDEPDIIKVAVVGKPNVGKSSLINRILGSERLVVSELPGTTRDSVDTNFEWKGIQYSFIDTAGIRRRTQVKEKIEKFSIIKALKSLQRCHVACVLIDATDGVTEQDARICGYALERGKAIIIVINKWDLVKHDKAKKGELQRSLDRQLGFLSFAPKVKTSALTGEGVVGLFAQINNVYSEFSKSVKTAEVNRVLKEIILRHPPAVVGNKRPGFSYATQVDTRPPTFVVFVNRPEWIQSAYERYLLNQFRSQLGFTLTPIRIILKRKRTNKGTRPARTRM
ncbi:MAG TPA: ribosome biogenesis GTPase Der [Desulfobacteraceae bacterium]|nr:ribosome biogenesis GTPase Der [Desulfobacteraceae bacterium]